MSSVRAPGAIVRRRQITGAVSGIDHVPDDLAAAFDGTLPPETVRRVALHARRDLEREVPPEALAEFTHRLAWQRLTDLRQQAPDRHSARDVLAGVA